MIKKGGLAKRYASSYQTRDGNGNSGSRVLDFKGKEVEFYAPQEGRNLISIVPYEIKTDKHPLVRNKTLEVGDMDYVMDIWEHRGVGPAQGSVLCLKNTYGKPCPICEEAARLKKEGKEDEAKALKARRRVYYNVLDPKDGKVKVFATSHYLFEKELIEEAKNDEDGGYTDFADPDEGRDVRFRATKESLAGQEYFTYKSFSFEDREAPLSKKILANAISFDECINIPTYKEVENMLYGAEDEEEEERGREIPQPDRSKAVDDADAPWGDDDIPAKRPSNSRTESESTSKTYVAKDAPEAHNDKCNKCPFGHIYGKDRDKFDDCDDCDVWGECYKA